MFNVFNWLRDIRERQIQWDSNKHTRAENDEDKPQELTYTTQHDEERNLSYIIDVAPRDEQQILRGYKKHFHENLDYSLKLIKERLPDENLTFEQFIVGSRGKKRIVIVYLKDVANPSIVTEVRSRIKAIKAETLFDSSYLERNIENSNLSPFPQVEVTTRPDITEAALIQGRIGIFLDGSPEILIVPTTFFELMDTPEDAYSRWFLAANFFRIVRYLMLFTAASLPAFYIALTSHNPEMLPSRLAFRIAASAEGTPFPVYFEAFIMMGVVEAVRLILIKMPNSVGSAITIFSGVVLVGAGLLANIFGEAVVIIVTLTAIVSFSVPNYDLRTAVRIIQFFTMIMTTMFGMFGYALAFFYIATRMVTLKSFGIPYLAPLAPLEASGWGHTIFRDNTTVMAQDETYKPLSKIDSQSEKGDNDE